MTEAPKLAQEFVERDAKNAAQTFREMNIPFDARHYDEVSSIEITDRTLVAMVIGTRGQLTKREAERAARVWKEVRAKSPDSPIYPHFIGYDDDPRDLHEFPDVKRYLRRWARAVGLDDLETAINEVGDEIQFPHLLSMLAICGVFGEEIAKQVKAPPPQQPH